MGAGVLMTTSIHKSANLFSRIHMVIADATERTNFQGKLLPINDGCYMVSTSRVSLLRAFQCVMCSLAAIFVATPDPNDRYMVRVSLAFGPVYSKDQLAPCIGGNFVAKHNGFLDQVLFGSPIIQAYTAESEAVPFGVAVHESARTFAEAGEQPFNLNHWFWWHHEDSLARPAGVPPLKHTAGHLQHELSKHLDWMCDHGLFNRLPADKIRTWKKGAEQYFASASRVP